jgi:hypothetical protein
MRMGGDLENLAVLATHVNVAPYRWQSASVRLDTWVFDQDAIAAVHGRGASPSPNAPSEAQGDGGRRRANSRRVVRFWHGGANNRHDARLDWAGQLGPVGADKIEIGTTCRTTCGHPIWLQVVDGLGDGKRDYRIVDLAVAGSSPVIHPDARRCLLAQIDAKRPFF